MIKLTDILRLTLKEVHEDHSNPEFDADPMGYILKRYKKLNRTLTEIMGKNYREYLSGVFIQAEKPTTFKILLKNGQMFFMTYMEKAYEASVLGKRYYLLNIGETQRASSAIANLLRYGAPSKSQGSGDEVGSKTEKLPTEKEEKPEAPESETL